MLQQLRSNKKKYYWTLYAVIAAFVLGFIMTDAFRSEKADAQSELVYIDGEPVIRGIDYYQQLRRYVEMYRTRFKGNNLNKSMIMQMGIPQQIMTSMLKETLIKSEAENLDIAVTEDEIKSYIINSPQFQRDGKFIGIQALEQILATYYKTSADEFKNEVRNMLLSDKLENLVAGSLVADPDTLQDEYKKDKDKVEADLIVFRTDRVKDEVTIDDSEIPTYYQNHKNEFKSDEKRSGYVIVKKFDDFKKEVKISDKEIRDYFANNKTDFSIPGRTKVSRISLKYTPETREEILKKAEALQVELNAANFSDKSKEVSEDAKSQTGGDYGYYDWKNFSTSELSLIDSMDANKISPVIDTNTGTFSILFIAEKTKTIDPDFLQVQPRIKDILEREKLNQIVKTKIEDIYKKIEKADNIKAKATEEGEKVIETQLLTNGQNIKDIDEVGYISRELFSLKGNKISSPVQLMNGWAIVQLNKIEKSAIEPLEKVRERVKEKVRTAKKVDLLKTEAASIAAELAKLTDAKQIEEFLKGKNLTSEATSYKRGNQLSSLPYKKGLDDTIFALEINQYSSPIAFDDSVAILKAKTKTITTPADFEKEKTTFYDQKNKELRSTYFNAYLSKKMANMKVTTNPTRIQQTEEEALRGL